MNKVILGGRLTKDVELRYTPNGVAVATGTLAVNRRNKREGQPDADFINIVIWQKAAENAANMIGKGCRVNIVGRWETRNFEGQDGKRVYVNECIVEDIEFIDYKDNGERQGGQNNQSNTNTSGSNQNRGGGQYGGQGGGNQYRQNDDPFDGNGQIDISDDDLPF